MKQHLPYLNLVIVATLWTVLAFILPDFLDNPMEGVRSALILLVYLGVLGTASFFVLLIGCLNRHVAAVFLPIYAIAGSVVAYYRYAYHATVTPIILQVCLETNPSEAMAVVSWELVAYTLLNLLIAAVLIWWRWRIKSIPSSWAWLVAGLVGLPVYYLFNGRIRQSINQRYPYNILYNSVLYYQLQQTRSQERVLHPITEIDSTRDSLRIILILGEATRADHLSLNGYPRPTTPRLEKRNNLVNLGSVYTMHTHTSASLPYLLTPADARHPEWAYSEESFIPYLREAGYATAWISNQDICENYAHFVYSTDMQVFPNSEKTVYVFDKWTDLDLLQPLVEQLQDTGKHLIILHTIGAHWYYENHVPEGFSPFAPVTTNRVITRNDSAAVINSYDNCVATMDWVVDSICTLVAHTPTVVIYQSDHGEALGENGQWLHASETEQQHYAAGFIYYTDAFAQRYPELVETYQNLSRQSLETDYLFPLILQTAGIKYACDED